MQLNEEQVVKIGITIWTIIFGCALISQIAIGKFGNWTVTSLIGVALGLYGLRSFKKRNVN